MATLTFLTIRDFEEDVIGTVTLKQRLTGGGF